MTASITTTKVSTPVALPNGDFTPRQIELINTAWQNFKQSNNHRLQCAIALWELKQDLDASDPNVTNGGGGRGTTKFWKLFESGALPYSGSSGRTTVFTALEAAEWLEEQRSKGLDSSFDRLAPATIVEIKALDEPAREIVYENLASSNFIGVAAVRLLKHVNHKRSIAKLKTWVSQNQGKALTPAAIRPITELEREHELSKRFQQEQSTRASDAVVDMTIDTDRRDRLRAEVKAKEVQEELDRPAQEEQEQLENQVRLYNSKLNAAEGSLDDLCAELRKISSIEGTQYLDTMRSINIMGLVSVADDLQRIKNMGDLLLQIAELANSSDPPTTFDPTTINL